MPSTLDEEETRRELHQLIDVDKGAALLAVSLQKKWSMKKKVQFMINFLEVQVVAKQNGTHRIKHRVVNASGGVKPGEGMKLLKVLSTVVLPDSRRTTAIGSICANSKSARGLSPSGELRSFFVGQVVILKNDDNKFRENWYVMLKSLSPPSSSDPSLIGVGNWLWGEEDVRAHPGCKGFVMEGLGREVMVSDYEFEVRVNNVIGVCRAYPTFLDNGLEEDLVYGSYFDYAEKTRHVLKEPTTPSKQRDLAKVLLIQRSVALRAHPVSSCSIFLVVCVFFVFYFCYNNNDEHRGRLRINT
jgi:hypothetical protein